MRAVDLIRRKRDGHTLEPRDIRAFVAGVVDGSWADYQVSAFLMAVLLKGMTADEAAVLTDAMVHSGVTLEFPAWGQAVVDKHSTGGVGDKVSLVLGPLAAACGVRVPMVSGRGLGHTGGTLDKLESIPGFRTRLSIDEIRAGMEANGCVLVGQTDEMAPADRRLYAIRDVTGTVESVPLIAASILSKKIAEGIKGLVLDVKVGSGAFMPTLDHARTLATNIIRIAAINGVRTEATITAMHRPLGRAVGNAVEVIEAIETLKGRGPEDTERLSVFLTARMLVLGGVVDTHEEAERRVRGALERGDGLERLRRVIESQGGDGRVVDDYDGFPAAAHQLTVPAPATGRLAELDAGAVGRAAVALGAGRDRADAPIDPSAGIEILLDSGADVRAGEAVLVVSGSERRKVEAAFELLTDVVRIVEDEPLAGSLIYETLDEASIG